MIAYSSGIRRPSLAGPGWKAHLDTMLLELEIRPGPEDSETKRRARLRAELSRMISGVLSSDGEHACAVPGLALVRRDSPCEAVSALYEPSLALPVQGSKDVILGGDRIEYDPDHFLLTSIDLPTMSQVTAASPSHPFLAILLRLDMAIVQDVAATIDILALPGDLARVPMARGSVTADLLDVLSRLSRLPDHPGDIPFLAPLLMRELTYRLLLSPAGRWLRETARLGTRCNRLARVIAWLRANHARAVRIEELAEMAAMSVSTFHHHFAAATRMSPLQFQKQFRLHEARRLLLVEPIDAATAGVRIGYDSATQFNREYRRLFGNPPIRDVAPLRERGRTD